MSVDVANESGTPVDERALSALSSHVLAELGVHPMAELAVRLVDEPSMTELHQRFMGEPGPTDVLAFPMDELDARGPGPDVVGDEQSMLGDVVLCPAVAERQAVDAGHSTADELHLLCTHGVLHLLGYDHDAPETEREMFELQRRLLASWRRGS